MRGPGQRYMRRAVPLRSVTVPCLVGRELANSNNAALIPVKTDARTDITRCYTFRVKSTNVGVPSYNVDTTSSFRTLRDQPEVQGLCEALGIKDGTLVLGDSTVIRFQYYLTTYHR